jgi:hypothetical protein
MPPTLANSKICYIEMPATDIARSAEFYQRAFGWNIRLQGDGHKAAVPPNRAPSGHGRLVYPQFAPPFPGLLHAPDFRERLICSRQLRLLDFWIEPVSRERSQAAGTEGNGKSRDGTAIEKLRRPRLPSVRHCDASWSRRIEAAR